MFLARIKLILNYGIKIKNNFINRKINQKFGIIILFLLIQFSYYDIIIKLINVFEMGNFFF